MSRYLLSLFLFIFSVIVWANDPFAELDREIFRFNAEQGNAQSVQDDFQQYVQSQQSEYQNWQREYLEEFDQFQQSVVEKWGRAELINATSDIEFTENKNVKSVIDYENETVRVELIIDKALSDKEAEVAIKKQVKKLLADKKSNIAKVFEGESFQEQGDIALAEVQFSEKNKQQSKAIIVQQTQSQAQEIDKKSDLALLEGSLLTEQEARLLASQEKSELLKSSQERLSTTEKNYNTAQKNANNDTKIVSYTVKLPKNSLQKNARKYAHFAEFESKVNHISAPLIMAIMHSESAFNPNAKSAVPAYGLMQIVPHTAGHDVNRLIRNIDKPMSADELYVPKINVETGSAYLNILDKRYLKAISNEQSRLYCTIASYNTGAGNVARAFNKDGSRNINKAAKVINQLSPDEVYQQLIAKLPYDETKHYLQRVNSRIALYQTSL